MRLLVSLLSRSVFLKSSHVAVNPGLCRSLRKLSRQKTADAAYRVAVMINTINLPRRDGFSNSMDVIRIFEECTRKR